MFGIKSDAAHIAAATVGMCLIIVLSYVTESANCSIGLVKRQFVIYHVLARFKLNLGLCGLSFSPQISPGL